MNRSKTKLDFIKFYSPSRLFKSILAKFLSFVFNFFLINLASGLGIYVDLVIVLLSEFLAAVVALYALDAQVPFFVSFEASLQRVALATASDVTNISLFTGVFSHMLKEKLWRVEVLRTVLVMALPNGHFEVEVVRRGLEDQ